MITSFIEGKNVSSNTPVDGDCPMLNTSDRDLEDHIFSAIPNDDVDKIDNRLKVELEQLNESICLELQQEQRVTISSTDVITYDSFSTVTSTEDPLSLHEISQTLDNDNHSNNSEDVFCLNENDYQTILDHLRLDKSLKIREKLDQNSLKKLFLNPSAMSAVFNKKTILACLKSIACKLKDKKIHFLISWPKYKITEFLNHIAVGIEVKKVATSRRKNVLSLQKLCEKVIRTFSKDILNIVDAEYAFPLEKQKWILDMPFEDNLEICGLTKQINWFSKPEYSRETSSFKFFLLDCHHILTNARIKCCKTGIPEAGIHRQAWMKLTTSEHGNILSKALVEDLVDCQSNSFAQQTFSQKVEDAMRLNGDNNEAMFCRLIREWYTAEDDPGIDVHERCMRRLALRQWLLKDVSLNKFPPPGAFIKGIPIVMYEGLLTNIDRRLQLFPFVKTGMYNVRSLGTLEAENLFGAFQDLDPKGSGVIRPDDIPSALSTSCEMLCYRFNKNRNHPFDKPERSKLTGTRRRVKSCISDPSMPARGIRPIRQFHRLDESKILPHVRKGLEFNDESEDI
ncbi:unnamed protein product [Mytilus edulis]|uniref:EF-hand domain-containing protein n=1 Tax=Mytilus edulis TaxID=6550 RepID=A0A8S3SHP3_MYTED|nr:unnamed protein product [Mytilus edulis]